MKYNYLFICKNTGVIIRQSDYFTDDKNAKKNMQNIEDGLNEDMEEVAFRLEYLIQNERILFLRIQKQI